MNKKIKLLQTYLDYSKTWAVGSLASALVAGLGLIQLESNKLFSSQWWMLVLILVTFGLMTIHMTHRYEERQKQLVKAIRNEK